MPNTTAGSTRPDGTDALALARKNGYNVFTNRTGFDALQGGSAKAAAKPYLGLFHASHMNYEIDRDPAKEPSLLEMAKTAITSLQKATRYSDKGYFIVRRIFARVDWLWTDVVVGRWLKLRYDSSDRL